jgi:hypothetical protein
MTTVESCGILAASTGHSTRVHIPQHVNLMVTFGSGGRYERETL